MQNSLKSHVFDTASPTAERSTLLVTWITAIAMVVEITAGWSFNSIALLTDGWNMASHVMITSLSVIAYKAARHYAHDPNFAFGSWKIEILSAFTGSIALLAIAILMLINSVERLFVPQHIQYGAAIMTAMLGLVINLVSAKLLSKAHDHNGEHDLNLKSVYLHVLADAATSILAIIALIGGLLYGWAWLDPLMGIIGAILITIWSKNLLLSSAKILLDREMDHPIVTTIRQTLENSPSGEPISITDLHVWRVGKNSYSCALSLITSNKNLTPASIRAQLAQFTEIVHCTIEIQHSNLLY